MLFQSPEEQGKWYVLEAVQPVKITAFEQWITHGDDHHYVVKRLKDAEKIMTAEVTNEMIAMGKKMIGKNYDLYFGWSDDRIYCSELVWKLYKRTTGLSIGATQKFEELNFKHPEVKRILKERYGNDLPLQETIISPGAMFESELLVEVGRN